MTELVDDTNGRPYEVTPSLWMVRVTTDGNGGLLEVPVRPCTAAECRTVEASIAARMPAPTPYLRAAPTP